MGIIIYHNPKCSKSRQALELLESQNIHPEIELYLQKHYSIKELEKLKNKLNIKSVRNMMRIKDDLYKSLNLDNPELTESDLLNAISKNSALLERPIIINGEKACIGRPLETILSIL